MGNDVEVIEQTETAPVVQNTTHDVVSMLSLAVEKGLDVECIRELMALKHDQEDRENKRLFFEALAQFQYDCPEIKKSKNVSYTSRKTGQKTNYFYAPLGSIREQIKKPLFDAGISYRFEMKTEPQRIIVTCVLTHVNGHSEKTSLESPADNSGGKNTIQANGSTVTYLQRYTLLTALGIVTADEDNDGGTHPDPTPQRNNNSRPPQEEAEFVAISSGEYWVQKGSFEGCQLKALGLDELATVGTEVFKGHKLLDTFKRYYAVRREQAKAATA
jgi:hypothetical protein